MKFEALKNKKVPNIGKCQPEQIIWWQRYHKFQLYQLWYTQRILC